MISRCTRARDFAYFHARARFSFVRPASPESSTSTSKSVYVCVWKFFFQEKRSKHTFRSIKQSAGTTPFRLSRSTRVRRAENCGVRDYEYRQACVCACVYVWRDRCGGSTIHQQGYIKGIVSDTTHIPGLPPRMRALQVCLVGIFRSIDVDQKSWPLLLHLTLSQVHGMCVLGTGA